MVIFSFCSVYMAGNTLFSSCSLDYKESRREMQSLFWENPTKKRGEILNKIVQNKAPPESGALFTQDTLSYSSRQEPFSRSARR